MRIVARCLLLCAMVLLCSAHVGSPDVWYEGPAGPYNVRVLVRPPAVVPGLADIVVDAEGGAQRVQVTVASWSTGAEGAPAPDEAKPRAGKPGSFSAQLWLMARGAYRVVITVHGTRGDGVAIVPVTAVATIRRPMSRVLGAILAGLCLFLLFGLVSIVGSAVRESLLPPGVAVDDGAERRARRGMVTAFVVASAVLLVGFRWWIRVDEQHRMRLDHTWTATAVPRTAGGARSIEFAITDSAWLMRDDTALTRQTGFFVARGLVPDHGKIMHLFLIRDGDMASFAHLHPSTPDENRFSAELPPLQAGRYHVFGDVVELNGTARTIVARTVLAANTVTDLAANAATSHVTSTGDADDAAWTGSALGTLSAPQLTLEDGSVFTWLGPSAYRVDQPVEITADITDRAGHLATLEPYMGMAGHAVIANAEGTVFVHLHPLGTISMAAQEIVTHSGVTALPVMAMTMAAASAHITFPYAFPRAGKYRIWIQVKHNGRILTGAHDVDVTR